MAVFRPAIQPLDTGSSGGIHYLIEAFALFRGQRSTILQIVEKPDPAEAPSNSAVVGRYLLVPEIFDKLEKIGRGAGGEIQLTDGIANLLDESPVYAYSFDGVRYDCGSKLGYLQATVAYGLEHAETGDGFREHLEKVLAESSK